MTPNASLKHQFIVMLFIAGSLSYAQENRHVSDNETAQANHSITVNQEQIGCLEYSGYVVSRKTGDPIAGARIDIKNSSSESVTTIIADENGYYEVVMPCNEKCKMVFVGEGYSKELRIVKTGENFKSPSRNNRIYLTPFDSLVENDGSIEKIKVDPIFFDSDKTSTVAWDKMTIEKVLFTMLKFPEIRIKIESHSNAGGSDISNAVLSYFHAKSTRRYLISQGIDADRIESANGNGTGCLEEDCADGLDCEDLESTDSTSSDFIIVSN